MSHIVAGLLWTRNLADCALFCCKAPGSGRALKKWGKTIDCVSCFPLHFFRALPLLRALQQNRAQPRIGTVPDKKGNTNLKSYV